MTPPADILFVHNNFPGQYRLLAARLAATPGLRVFAVGAQTAVEMTGVRLQRYRLRGGNSRDVHSFAQRFEIECRRAEQVIYAANALKLSGMSPRLIFAHPGWGESLPLRQLFPDAKICVYCEFYYNPRGIDIGFDPEFQGYGIDGMTRIQLRNAATLLALAEADIGIAPTEWQRSLFPLEFQSKIEVLHDGIDTDLLQPGPARFAHRNLPKPVASGAEVLTFVSRGLEPYRGFHIFMRSLPGILAARRKAQVCIVGGDQVAYGSPPANGGSWKEVMLREVGDRLDLSRVHFLDRLPFADLVTLLRVSRAHVYLTYPFVLSWSLLEAMALGCLIVASDAAPVREVITDGVNGLLVPFFDIDRLAETTIAALASPDRFALLGTAASATVSDRFSFTRVSLPQFHRLIAKLAPEIGQRLVGAGAPRPARARQALLETSHA